MRIGYFLASRGVLPSELVEQANAGGAGRVRRAVDLRPLPPMERRAGSSSFVWSVIGALSQACSLPVTTAVTCPTVRIHPAIVAQAAATSAVLLDGRFQLGVGSGEALNEHVTGARWPSVTRDFEMLEEAVDVMRELWTGDYVTSHGEHYTVENARIYTRPESPPPVYVSGFGPKRSSSPRGSATVLVTTPDKDAIELYRSEAGPGRCTPAPRCASRPMRRGARHRSSAVVNRPARRTGPGLPSPLRAGTRARRARDAGDTGRGLTSTRTSHRCVNTPTPASMNSLVQQIGPEQDAFFDRWAAEILPEFAGAATR